MRIGLPVAALAFTVVVSVLADLPSAGVSFGEQIVICLLSMVVVAVVQIQIEAIIQTRHQVRAFEEWKVRNEGERLLRRISEDYGRVVQDAKGSRDLFVRHIERDLSELARRVTQASNTRSLLVEDHRFTSADDVMATFQATHDPIFRYTWKIEPDEPLFAYSSWTHYFALTEELVKKRGIKSVRAILVLAEGCTLDDEKCNKLVRFYCSTPNYACSVITESNYEAIRQDLGFAGHTFIEFGVYGEDLLYLSQDYGKRSDGGQKIEGTFYKDPATIVEFVEGFEAIFESALTMTLPTNAERRSGRVRLDELVKL